MTESDIPREVWGFIDELTPDDAGTTTMGDWVIHYEGFSGICLDDVEARMALPKDDPRAVDSLEDVLVEVEAEFRAELGNRHVACGASGDEDYPIVWAIGSADPSPEP